MTFGFDPSIILGATKAPESSLNDTLSTLAQLATHRTQQEHAQVQLADMMRTRQREGTLADIYKANAGTPEGLAPALMRGGFGREGLAAQDQAAEQDKRLRAIQKEHREHVGNLFYGVKDQAGWDAARQELAQHPDEMKAVYAGQIPEKFDPGVAERLGNLAMTPKERADLEQKGLDRSAAEKRARIMAATRREVAAAGGSAGDLTPEALDAEAAAYNVTKQLPQLGVGKPGAALRVKILNRARELSPEADLAGSKADYAANSASLKKQQQQSDAMNAFEGTALANLDTFLETAKAVVDTGSPLFNAPGRRFAEAVKGDPKMAAFNTARQTAVQEVGKVLSGSLGSAAISDGARHEVESLLKPDASLSQIMAAAKILKQDMANRKKSVEAQLQETRGRMKSKPAAPAKASGALSQEEAAELAQLKKELGQ